MVLRAGERQDVLAVAKRKEAGLFALKELLDDD